MASRRSRWKKAVPALTTITLTAAPFTLFCPTADAFFPPINNQINQLPPPVVIVDPPPFTPPVVVVPPVSPPPFVPPPPPVVVPPVSPPPVVVDPPCDCPGECHTPEPSTFLAGVAGLAAAASWTAARRKGSPEGKSGETTK